MSTAELEFCGEFGRQVLSLDPEIAANHVPIFHQVRHHSAGKVRRNGKADAQVSARAAEDGGVDADEVPVTSTSAPPELPGLIGASVWMKLSIILDAHAATVRRADNPVGHGLAYPEGMADGQHQIAHLHVPAFSQRDGGQVVGVNLDDRDVTLGIKSNNLGVELAPVLQRHLDLRWPTYKMAVGQDISVLSHNHPGPKPALQPGGQNLLGALFPKGNAREDPLSRLPGQHGCRFSGR